MTEPDALANPADREVRADPFRMAVMGACFVFTVTGMFLLQSLVHKGVMYGLTATCAVLILIHDRKHGATRRIGNPIGGMSLLILFTLYLAAQLAFAAVQLVFAAV